MQVVLMKIFFSGSFSPKVSLGHDVLARWKRYWLMKEVSDSRVLFPQKRN